MGIRADDEVSGYHGAGLGQQRVLDAGATLLPVVGDSLLAGEIAHLLGLLGALDILVRRVVVGHQADAVAVEHALRSQLAEHVDGDGGGDVVRKDYVEVAFDQLARADLVHAGVRCQDLLGYGHRSGHDCSFLLHASAHPPARKVRRNPPARWKRRRRRARADAR